MKCVLVILPPAELHANILTLSRAIGKQVYHRELNNVIYRTKTRQHCDNPRKIFIRGDGNVIEFEVEPHCTLVNPFDFGDGKASAVESPIRNICQRSPPFSCTLEGIGDHGGDFTMYVKLSSEPRLLKLRDDLIIGLQKHIPDFSGRIELAYVPHMTILYDDAEPEKVTRAKSMLNDISFTGSFPVREIHLLAQEQSQWRPVATFPLGRLEQ